MYFPYFRGRREELNAIISTADILAAKKKIMPIIEPVRENAREVARCANACNNSGITLGLVVNPSVGRIVGNPSIVSQIFSDARGTGCTVIPFFLIGPSTTAANIAEFLAKNKSGMVGFVHFSEPSNQSGILRSLGTVSSRATHLFIDGGCSAHYVQSVTGNIRALVRDGFLRRIRNADYPEFPEFFSDLHATYSSDGFDGFGDFLTIGRDHIEGGGAPRAIALHLTTGTPRLIQCYHFVSTSNQTPANRDRKYREALEKLNNFVIASPSTFRNSAAVSEFLSDHEAGTSTSLGMMKRRSMRHHLYMMCGLV